MKRVSLNPRAVTTPIRVGSFFDQGLPVGENLVVDGMPVTAHNARTPRPNPSNISHSEPASSALSEATLSSDKRAGVGARFVLGAEG
jgi:hypothetical protein